MALVLVPAAPARRRPAPLGLGAPPPGGPQAGPALGLDRRLRRRPTRSRSSWCWSSPTAPRRRVDLPRRVHVLPAARTGCSRCAIMTALAPELAQRATRRSDIDGLRDQFSASGCGMLVLAMLPAGDRHGGARAPDHQRAARPRDFTRAVRSRRPPRRSRAFAIGLVSRSRRTSSRRARVLLDAGHAHAVPAQLSRERRQHRAPRSRSTEWLRRRGARAGRGRSRTSSALVAALAAIRRRLGRLDGRAHASTRCVRVVVARSCPRGVVVVRSTTRSATRRFAASADRSLVAARPRRRRRCSPARSSSSASP